MNHPNTGLSCIRKALLLPLLLAANFACGPDRTSRLPDIGKHADGATGLFEDATERAGIRFHHTNGDSAAFRFPETFGGGCAFLDYDEDGDLDAALLSCGRLDAQADSAPPNIALYCNEGNGRFVDVTRGSGLDRPLGYAQAIAVGDYNNDGFPDLFVAGYGGCSLFRNRGAHERTTNDRRKTKNERRISESAIHQPSSVPPEGPNTRNPNGQTPQHPKSKGPIFEDVTDSAGVSDRDQGIRWASGAAFGDYDRDGWLDLLVIRYARWSPETDKKCPRPDGSPGYCVPDVYDPDSVRLYRNLGGERFQDVTAIAGLGAIRGRGLAVAWLDYDLDGHEDFFVANDLNPNALLRNRGNGTFKEVGAEAGAAFGGDGLVASGMGVALGDYDHSGRESLLIPNLNGERFTLLHAEPGGMFSYATESAGLSSATLHHSGWGAAFMDLNRDGWCDLVTANGNVHPAVARDMPGISYEEPKGVFLNTGSGGFRDITAGSGAMTVPRAARGLAVGDYDDDGRLDVLCVNRNERVDLFRGVSQDAGRWLNVKLIGTKSNRDGAGAKLRLKAGGIRQFAQCRLSSSYASSSDRRIFFGLGAAETVEELEILWPSGIRDNYRNLPVNQVLLCTEGGGWRQRPAARGSL